MTDEPIFPTFPPSPDNPKAITVTYTNHRGETSARRIYPIMLWFGASTWHPEPQWLILVWDFDKGAHRDYALKDFGGRL